MKPDVILLDTNLLVLYVVGAASRSYIERHKKLGAYLPEDYDALLALLSAAHGVVVTPNTLTETSNLAPMMAEPARTEILSVLKLVIDSATETYIPSRSVSGTEQFMRLGLADTATLEALNQDITLLTTDLDLHVAAQTRGLPSINFNELREGYLLQ